MIEIKFMSEAINYIAEEEIIREHEKRAEKAIKAERLKELMAEGVDKEVAKAMVAAGL